MVCASGIAATELYTSNDSGLQIQIRVFCSDPDSYSKKNIRAGSGLNIQIQISSDHTKKKSFDIYWP